MGTMIHPYVTVRHQGRVIRVRRLPVETEEQAKDRAWYVAKQLPKDMPSEEKESRSRAWANEKYYGMKYEC